MRLFERITTWFEDWTLPADPGIGSEGNLAVHALAELMRQHRYEHDYVLLRSDMTSAVQQE